MMQEDSSSSSLKGTDENMIVLVSDHFHQSHGQIYSHLSEFTRSGQQESDKIRWDWTQWNFR